MKRMDKKGQQMTLGTIIAIVLGIVVLVFLIFGFSSGWSNMWDRVINFGGGSSNVDTIKQGCASACASNSEYEFCNQKRTLKFGENVVNLGENCEALTDNSQRNKCDASCDELAASGVHPKISGIGISDCSAIACNPSSVVPNSP